MRECPLVSIVIPTYNCPYIANAIESALAQSYLRKEIIVVNDGSTKHKEKIKPYYDRIRYIEKKNGGIASALNTGIKLSRGQFFAWMCSDDLIDPHKVAKQISFMQTKGAVASHTAFYRMDVKKKIIDQFLIKAFTKNQLLAAMMKGNVINGATVMLNKKVFDEVGFFNENLRCAQDYDMWCRILMKYHIHYLNAPLYKYRIHGNMISKRLKNVLDKERALVIHEYKDILRGLIKHQ